MCQSHACIIYYLVTIVLNELGCSLFTVVVLESVLDKCHGLQVLQIL